jgi:Fe-S cluster biogenesis protein NfuA
LSILADSGGGRGILSEAYGAGGLPPPSPSFFINPPPVLEPDMISRDRVQAVIERIRPLIQGDGGDIELVEVVDNKAKVRLTGNCVGCPSAQMTLFMGVEMAIKEEIPEFEELLVV